MFFTTSWDDGYKLDLPLADMLEAYSATGTFYVCPHTQYNQPMLSKQEIKDLSERHEIGAHTINHPKLAKCDPDQARKEIEESKAWVEDATGKECAMFCYPYGNESEPVRRMVEQAGYRGARTTEMMQFSPPQDRFGLPTSQQVYPFPWRKRFVYWWHFLDIAGRYRYQRKELRAYGVSILHCRNWLSMAKKLFTKALENNEPFFHIWGHSQELERYKQWKDLEGLLAFIDEHKADVTHVTNGQLIEELY